MIEAAGATDPGCVRENNEDFFLIAPALGLYVVADGMGGAAAGEHAARMAVNTLSSAVNGALRPPKLEDLVEAFNQANDLVYEASRADKSREGMGTTLLAALENSGDLMVANVGDSRAYAYSGGELKAITEDQSWVNEVGRKLGIDEASLKHHPMRHVLTMAVGVSDQLRVATYKVHPEPGCQILLCSDGLHGVASENDIAAVLSSADPPDAKCRKLISLARASGGPDNITVVLLKIS